MKKILFITSSYGAYNGIKPIIKIINSQENFKIGYIGIKKLNIKNLIFDKKLKKNLRENKAIIEKELKKFDVYFTGAPEYSNLELYIWKYAKKENKKSLCFLDQSKNFELRFYKLKKAVLPDIICVQDNYIKRELINYGINKQKIKNIGSVFLENLKEKRISKKEKKEIILNRKLENKKIITFCTEYIRKNKEKKKYNYDEYDILNDIIEYIKKNKHKVYKLFIRLHPNDNYKIYEDYKNKINEKNLKIEIIKQDPDYKLLQISDVVIGMTSIILYEASYLGLNCISYQPVLDEKKIFYPYPLIKKILVIKKQDFFKKVHKILNKRSIMPLKFLKKEKIHLIPIINFIKK